MKIEVAKNTKRNIIVGVLNKTVLVILPFVVRSVIVNVLGSQYLGLNSLFTSILSELALSEMRFGVGDDLPRCGVDVLEGDAGRQRLAPRPLRVGDQ